MPRVTRLLAALLVPALGFALAAARSSSSSPQDSPAPVVPVAGADLSGLVGKWVGEYSSPDTGRTGSIVLEFKSGGKTARGDVLMVPKGAYAPTPVPGADLAQSMPHVLQISFVNVEGGAVQGTMDPYVDPECNCQVDTTFVGKIQGDTIEGTYTSTPQGKGAPSAGRWKVTRQAPPK